MTETCPHPPARHFAWVAHDGTLCIGCYQCGAVLKGEAEQPEEPSEQFHDNL